MSQVAGKYTHFKKLTDVAASLRDLRLGHAGLHEGQVVGVLLDDGDEVLQPLLLLPQDLWARHIYYFLFCKAL